MRHILPAFLFLAACSGGQSNEEALQNAAAQSDPAAAAALNNAAETGTDPQQALEQAGQAQLSENGQGNGALEARPNLPQSPNRKDGTQPPDKMDANAQ